MAISERYWRFLNNDTATKFWGLFELVLNAGGTDLLSAATVHDYANVNPSFLADLTDGDTSSGSTFLKTLPRYVTYDLGSAYTPDEFKVYTSSSSFTPATMEIHVSSDGTNYETLTSFSLTVFSGWQTVDLTPFIGGGGGKRLIDGFNGPLITGGLIR